MSTLITPFLFDCSDDVLRNNHELIEVNCQRCYNRVVMSSNNDRKKVFVALSGGVDSSVSAALLQREGYAVTGVFIKVWHPDFLPCTWKEERLDAMRVCAALDISFLTFDLESEYKDHVVNYMINEYASGRTPNPDVMCNQYIKFGAFLEKAIERGADYIATGHYAIIKREAKSKKQKANYQLYAGIDTNKDQSYFLWTLNQEVLKRTLFPIGGHTKPKVRMLARKFGLLTSEKKDSQGLCFMGNVDMAEFLKKYIPTSKGAVVNVKGQVVGSHMGIAFSTVGQRHGVGVITVSPLEKPYYVIQKDASTNTLVVSHDPFTQKTNTKEVRLENENWISGTLPAARNYLARFRHRQDLEVCKLFFDSDGKPIVQFENPQIGLSSGQSVVLYSGPRCIGGGIMK